MIGTILLLHFLLHLASSFSLYDIEEAINYFSLGQVSIHCDEQIARTQLAYLNAAWIMESANDNDTILSHKKHVIVCWNNTSVSIGSIIASNDKTVILCNGNCTHAMGSTKTNLGDVVYFFDISSKITFESYHLKNNIHVMQTITEGKSSRILEWDIHHSIAMRRRNLHGVEILTLIEFQAPYMFLKKGVNLKLLPQVEKSSIM